MKQFMDVFSIPEMTLLAAANDYFISNDIEYDPVHLYKDVSVSQISQYVNLYKQPSSLLYLPNIRKIVSEFAQWSQSVFLDCGKGLQTAFVI